MTSTTVPVTARRAQTRERLIVAAVHVFADRGVLGSSVEEICERAGFTRGAFYSNFASKDELCLALVRTHCDMQIERVRTTLEVTANEVPSHNLDDLLARAISHFIAVQGTDRDTPLALAELQLYAARNPDFAPTYHEVDQTITDLFAEIIDEAFSSRGYRFVLPAREIVTMMKGVFEQYKLSEFNGFSDPDRQTEQLVNLLKALLVHRG